MKFNPEISLGDIGDILSALATFAAVLVALFPDMMREWFFTRRADLSLVNPEGQLEGADVVWKRVFHIKVRNVVKGRLSPSSSVVWPMTNCRVMLIDIHRREKGQTEFKRFFFPIARQFIWAPEENKNRAVTLYDEGIIDFGEIAPSTKPGTLIYSDWYRNMFSLLIHDQGGRFLDKVNPGETVRYTLQVVADHFKSEPVDFEVSWDGGWDESKQAPTGFEIKILRSCGCCS